jgi:2-polyprenyl-6-methoxyphenol hydroxylase-like FAD-dependent oxidoreductase
VFSTQTDIDVLIVGAGPVGLFLANECVRRGIRSQIVEMRATQSTRSKALAIFPRTLEILDMAGLVGPFVGRANRVSSVAIATRDRALAHLQFSPDESAYPFIAMLPQNVTEQLLADQLRQRGGAVEYETSFVSAVQDDDHVRVTLEQKGTRSTLTTAFVVGCDGAHSAIRHLLDLPFVGAEYESSFMLADIETNEALPANELQLCPSELGPVAIFPMSATRRRIVATIDHAEGDAPSLELVQRILRSRAPSVIEARALHWSSYFRIHHRHTNQLRVGRVFIAGDAAHIHSPFGGQGMNTGLHDVWNLAWKLDFAVRGRATEALLDSYAAERLPVIAQVIATTHRLTRVMGSHSPVAQALRDTLIPVVSRLAPFQSAFVERLSGLGVSYRGSPIIDGAGERYFDDSLRGGSGVGSRYLVLSPDRARTSVVEATSRLTGWPPDIIEIRPAAGRKLMLVRPDGYVAYTARTGDLIAELHAVQAVLARQVREGNPDWAPEMVSASGSASSR